jgi:hypothetical protein
MSFQTTGEEGSSKREAFKRDVANDLARASSLPAENFKISKLSAGSVKTDLVSVKRDLSKLSAGSVIVDIDILPDPRGIAPVPSAVARDLEQQAADPNSPLMSGKLTNQTQRIQVLSPQRERERERDRERERERAKKREREREIEEVRERIRLREGIRDREQERARERDRDRDGDRESDRDRGDRMGASGVPGVPALKNHANNHQFYTAISEAFDSVGLKDPGICMSIVYIAITRTFDSRGFKCCVCVCVCVREREREREREYL